MWDTLPPCHTLMWEIPTLKLIFYAKIQLLVLFTENIVIVTKNLQKIKHFVGDSKFFIDL